VSQQQQIPIDFAHRPATGKADFLVAPCNSDAVAWIDRWPDWPAPALVLYGPPGSGKSHLADVWRARSQAVAAGSSDLKRLLPPAGSFERMAVIDPLRPPYDEEALLHLYNLAAERGGHLLICSDTPPARASIALADLRSRLQACPAVGIGEPDDGLIGAVMLKQFSDRQIRIDPDVLTYLLARMERSFDAAGRVVAALDRTALAAKRRITVPLARSVLEILEKETQG
jgi:chromosomal replication initiation ATPase DnaA